MSDTPSRRADTDAKMGVLAGILKDVGCEAAILLVPAHMAWFTGGLSLRGLYAEGERPGVWTNGRNRWLVCGNADTQRLFDEELDGLGFMLKEWPWAGGRAQLLGDLVANKKVASDRPFPNMPLLVDRLRPELRPLYPFDRERFVELGAAVSHALEATARAMNPGDTEQEVAGQLAHRVLHHGAEVHAISVAANDRGGKYRRSGFTDAAVERRCTLQLTAVRGGLHATAARTVCFGPPDDPFRTAFEAACKLAAVFRAASTPNATISAAVDNGYPLLKNTPFEHDWRLSAAGYGTGWVPADELRKAGADEPFTDRQPLVWQPRVGAAAVVDTVVVTPAGAEAVTPPDDWPFKRITVAGRGYEIPDALVRSK
jgi:Xaa-Pro dipeptidase